MTQKSSVTRLKLYVGIAMLAAAGTGLPPVDFSDPKQVALYVISILSAGAITARSYIDKSPSEVIPSPATPANDNPPET